eukprot:XP_001702251.1 predicted protein [Chlamydomonas reinhardtii]
MEFAPDDGSQGANQGHFWCNFHARSLHCHPWQVPDWFFERTGVELKAQWQAARRRREEAAQLMRRAMRERQQQQQEDAGGTPSTASSSATATVRVRFPEGVCLQCHPSIHTHMMTQGCCVL